MSEEINEYLRYLLDFRMVEKPQMPKFNHLAYTDNEYVLAIEEIMQDFNLPEDESLSVKHLKGD